MFWIITILYILAMPAMYNFLWKAIQRGEMFGKWQDVLDWLFAKGYKNLEKFLGGCMVCFSHCIAWLAYIAWAIISSKYIEWWYFTFLWIVLVPITWYLGVMSKHLIDVLAEKVEKLQKENGK